MSIKKKVQTYSLKAMQALLLQEKDVGKRNQLRLLLDEMAEVYPDESEIPKDPKVLFKSPSEWRQHKEKMKLVCGILGKSTSGKTTLGLSASHLTKKYIMTDFSRLKTQELKDFIAYVEKYEPFTPVWVLGTEVSTLECLESEDNAEYFEHANIYYTELLAKGNTGLSYLDHLKTYKNFLIALYAISNSNQKGTILLDSGTTILNAQHEIVRRIIAGVPSLKKEQGIPTRRWFWRNVEQEGMMFFARIVPMNFIYTIKVIKQTFEDSGGTMQTVEKVKWHEETNMHLSNVIIRNQHKKGQFNSTILKCRKDSRLLNKTFINMNMPMFMYSQFLSHKQRIAEKEKRKT